MLPPGSVYFAALLSRLANTCVSRTLSPSTVSGSSGMSTDEPVLRGFDDRPAGLDRRRDDVRQIDRFVLHLDQPAGDAGDLEQVVDQTHEMTGLTLHHRHRAFSRRIRDGRALQQLDAGEQRR